MPGVKIKVCKLFSDNAVLPVFLVTECKKAVLKFCQLKKCV